MPLSTFPVPKKDPLYSFPNRFGIPDNIFNAIVQQCNIQIAAAGSGISGAWTPAITNNSNIASSSNISGFYLRVGSVIFFWGSISVTATVSGASTTFSLSLPVASNFGATSDATGIAVESLGVGGTMIADTAGDLLFCQYLSGSTSARAISFSGSYQVI